MQNRTKRSLIIISITLNILLTIFLVVKVLIPSTRSRHRSPHDSLFSDKTLNLSQDQKTQIQQLLQKFRVGLVSSKNDMVEKRMGIIEELSSPEPDHDLISTYVEESNNLESGLNVHFVEMLIDVSSILGPGQNIDFLLKISRPWLYFGRPPKKESNNDK